MNPTSLTFSRVETLSIDDETPHTLHVVFRDGTSGFVNLSTLIRDFPPFKPLIDEQLFKEAYLEEGVITWPNGLDIAPETVYELTQPVTVIKAKDFAPNPGVIRPKRTKS